MLKKLLIAEIIMLVILLITALVVCIGVPLGAFAPADVPASVEGTGQTTDPADTVLPGTSVPQPDETTEPKPTWFVPPEGYVLTAKQSFVFDCTADTYVSRTGNENTVYPASVTKLFSAFHKFISTFSAIHLYLPPLSKAIPIVLSDYNLLQDHRFLSKSVNNRNYKLNYYTFERSYWQQR